MRSVARRGAGAALLLLGAAAAAQETEPAAEQVAESTVESAAEPAAEQARPAADAAASAYRIQTQTEGNRRSRVTVIWRSGVTEVYQNKRDDALWSAAEQELGDQPNVRQWRLGGW